MSRPQTPPVNFLLVDDREENLLALEALLRRDGLRILKARSGDEALELLLTHDVALALLDVQMPDMDGFALAEFMRGVERSRHIPIIFITAAPQEQHREFRGYDAGAVDFLVKPINSQILWHKTRRSSSCTASGSSSPRRCGSTRCSLPRWVTSCVTR